MFEAASSDMIYQQIGRDDLSCPYVLNLLDQERESIESGGWTDGPCNGYVLLLRHCNKTIQ